MYKLVITEKPSVAKDIATVIGAKNKHKDYFWGVGQDGQEYRVTWLFGHILQIWVKEAEDSAWEKDNLPLLPKSFPLAPIPEKKGENAISNRLAVLKEMFADPYCRGIVAATDAGREGELIFRNVYNFLRCTKPFERLWISSMTEEAISDGFRHLYPGNTFDNLAKAAELRAQADWLVGINGTRALTISAVPPQLRLSGGRMLLSVGRVQTPLLRMICERFYENRMFKSEPYWFLQGESEKDGIRFRWRSVDTFKKAESAKEALLHLRHGRYVDVISVKTERKTDNPPLLFDIGALQKMANTRFSMTIEETLEIAQSLYMKRLITYPRTGSRYIPEDVFSTIPSLLRKLITNEIYGPSIEEIIDKPLNRRSVNDTKITDHHALICTGREPCDLTENEQKVYNLILARMVIAFSPVSVADITKVILAAGNVQIESRCRKEISLGWRAVNKLEDYEDIALEDVDEIEFNMRPLPCMKEGDKVEVVQSEIIEDKTKPKPLYSEATLLSAMETAGRNSDDKVVADALRDIGIGTPATRAAILEVLIRRRYVERRQKKLVPTSFGFAVFAALRERRISNVEMTASWELALNDIAEGKKNANDFDLAIRSYVKTLTSDIFSGKYERLAQEVESRIVHCPKCGGTIGIYEKACRCSNCNFVIWRTIAGKTLSEDSIRKLIKDGYTGVISGFKAKDEKEFSAIVILGEDGSTRLSFEKAQEKDLPCPQCHTPMKTYIKNISCPKCNITIWRTIAGKTLTDQQLYKLITKHKTDEIKGFKSKTGKEFSAMLTLSKDGKINFLFNKEKAR